jgi:hypothetical protein
MEPCKRQNTDCCENGDRPVLVSNENKRRNENKHHTKENTPHRVAKEDREKKTERMQSSRKQNNVESRIKQHDDMLNNMGIMVKNISKRTGKYEDALHTAH